MNETEIFEPQRSREPIIVVVPVPEEQRGFEEERFRPSRSGETGDVVRIVVLRKSFKITSETSS